eukprot:7443509-Ditylum_brightwellii.AAC.1
MWCTRGRAVSVEEKKPCSVMSCHVDPGACGESPSHRPAYVESWKSRRAYLFVPGEVSAHPKKVLLYKFSGVKTFLQMQKSHEYFLYQQEARKKHDLHDQADGVVLTQLETIQKDMRNKKEQAGMKKLQDMCMALDKKMDVLI